MPYLLNEKFTYVTHTSKENQLN
uniref:Uncharacterized protein n=1 Tax=Triatoma infestans TaxID=30076 RepID=A0A170XVQ9_TRIIF